MAYKCGYEAGYNDNCPKTIVPEIRKTARNRLGCGVHEAWIADRCTGVRICSLPDASRIVYNRILDDISEAEVEIAITGNLEEACCRCLGTVEPWCHDLVIARDGELVWQGPVQEILYSHSKVIIQAKDKLVWLQARVNEIEIPANGPNDPVTEFALLVAQVAMSEIDDCFFDCIIDLGDGVVIPDGLKAREAIPAFSGPTAYDQFLTVTETGLDFTVVRNCLLIGGEDFEDINPIATLQDRHILGEIEIRKDGRLMSNRIYARYTGDDDQTVCDSNGCAEVGGPPCPTPCPAIADNPEHFCYGLIERTIEDLGLPALAPAQATAEAYVNASPTVPRIIEFPSGARLSPDTPWKINDMFPGQRVDVILDTYCVPINHSFRLLSVEVEDTADGEAISVQLGNVNLITGAP